MYLQIIDPETNNVINLFTDRINELLNNGYTIKDILKLSENHPPHYNRENVFSDDLLMNYMYHLELHDIIALCSVDKQAKLLIHDKLLWQHKMDKYKHYFYDDRQYNPSIYNYNKMLHAEKIVMMYPVKQETTFEPNHNVDLSFIIGNRDYIPNTYRKQRIYINYYTLFGTYTINIKCTSDNISQPNFNGTTKDCYINGIKIFVFNLVFNLPNIPCIF